MAFRTLTPLPTGTANVVPAPDSRVPLRPPGAFAKRKDLTAKVCSSSCLQCSFAGFGHGGCHKFQQCSLSRTLCR